MRKLELNIIQTVHPDVEDVMFYPLIGIVLVTVLIMLLRRDALRGYIRRRRGQCMQCGYDLRNRLDEGCPECGWRRDAPVAALPENRSS